MILKKLALATSLVALMAVSATAQAPAQKDIVDTAVGAKSFNTLVSLVKQAGLVDVLKGKGPYTVFAPTDEAFKKLPKETLEAVAKDKELLKKVLLYHVVPGRFSSTEVMQIESARTALKDSHGTAQAIAFHIKNGKVMVNSSTVAAADVMASNGVIHVIDTVLIPPMD